MYTNLFLRLKRGYLNLPIAQKINLNSTFVVIIFIILLVFIADKASSDIIVKKTITNSVQNLELVNQNLNSLFDNVERMSNIVVSNSILQEYQNEVDPIVKFKNLYVIKANFDNILEPRNAASRIVVFGLDGSVLSSVKVNDAKVRANYDLYQGLEKELAAKWNPILWTDLHKIYYDRDNADTECISLKRNIIYSNYGSTVGRMIIDVNEDIISGIYSKVKYGKTGKFMIVNGGGEIVSSIDKLELHKKVGNKNYFEWILKNDRTGQVFDLDGRKFLVSSCKFNRMDWYILGMAPLDELTEDGNRLTVLIYLSGVVCMALAVTASFLLSRTISKPITKLSKLMNHAAEGQFNVRIDVQSNDEIGILAKSFNRMLSQISSLINEVYSEQKKKREYELIALQAQINPHFLYNTLESICSLIKLSRAEDALNLIQTLGKFYRMVLNKGENVVSIRHEIEIITQYMAIQKVRYFEQLNYLIDIDNEILDKKIIKLSIQPIVENAIYHGIKNKGDNGRIDIQGRVVGSEIIISITDDGVGMSEDSVRDLFTNTDEYNRRKSFGLRSVDERFKLYFGNDYGIKIYSQEGKGTQIDIILPNN